MSSILITKEKDWKFLGINKGYQCAVYEEGMFISQTTRNVPNIHFRFPDWRDSWHSRCLFSLQVNYNHNDYVYSESKFTDLLWDFPFVKFDTKEFSVFTEI